MERAHLEHLLRAAGAITGVRRFVVIGSQSILGSFPNAPAVVRQSREADLLPLDNQDQKTLDLIDGVLGEASVFDDTFGYHAQGVDMTTAILPSGWQSRLVEVCNENTSGTIGLCLDPHDLLAAKYVANRAKDREFARACWQAGLVDLNKLNKVLVQLPISPKELARVCNAVESDRSTLSL